MANVFFVLVTFFVGTKCCGDFYWRDYNGVIPEDAIPAGNSTYGTTYIGQAYLHGYGLLQGSIIPGRNEMHIPCYGVKIATTMIKILCAQDLKKYYWLRTTCSKYMNDVKHKCPVVGGYDQKAALIINALGVLHVGRTNKHGNVIIGNIAAYAKECPWFFYPLNGEEMKTDEIDVLIYNDYPVHLVKTERYAIF